MSVSRHPAGVPIGGQFAASRRSDAEVSLTGDRITPGLSARLDRLAADTSEHSGEAPVVIMVRDQYGLDSFAFDGVGTPVLVDIDLASDFDDCPADEEQAMEFLDHYLPEAVRISNPEARQHYMLTLSRVVAQMDDPSEAAGPLRMIAYAESLKVPSPRPAASAESSPYERLDAVRSEIEELEVRRSLGTARRFFPGADWVVLEPDDEYPVDALGQARVYDSSGGLVATVTQGDVEDGDEALLDVDPSGEMFDRFQAAYLSLRHSCGWRTHDFYDRNLK